MQWASTAAGSAGLALYGIVPGVLITLASWRAAFIVPGLICTAMAFVTAWNLRTGKIGDRPMPATPGRDRRPRRVLARLFRALGDHGAGRRDLAGGACSARRWSSRRASPARSPPCATGSRPGGWSPGRCCGSASRRR